MRRSSRTRDSNSEHFAFRYGLRDRADFLAGGPLDDQDDERLRGLSIWSCDPETARRVSTEDPAVKRPARGRGDDVAGSRGQRPLRAGARAAVGGRGGGRLRTARRSGVRHGLPELSEQRDRVPLGVEQVGEALPPEGVPRLGLPLEPSVHDARVCGVHLGGVGTAGRPAPPSDEPGSAGPARSAGSAPPCPTSGSPHRAPALPRGPRRDPGRRPRSGRRSGATRQGSRS